MTVGVGTEKGQGVVSQEGKSPLGVSPDSSLIRPVPVISGAMVATVDDILRIVRSNPFIDGVGYFIEITTTKPVPKGAEEKLTERIQEAFCAHAQVTVEGDDVLGLDFHEHIFTQGEGADEDMEELEHLLKHVEANYGIDHLCIEFQFDFERARKAQKHLDELLKP
jgi:hypothetical protein